jgi:hypothetical protein
LEEDDLGMTASLEVGSGSAGQVPEINDVKTGIAKGLPYLEGTPYF